MEYGLFKSEIIEKPLEKKLKNSKEYFCLNNFCFNYVWLEFYGVINRITRINCLLIKLTLIEMNIENTQSIFLLGQISCYFALSHRPAQSLLCWLKHTQSYNDHLQYDNLVPSRFNYAAIFFLHIPWMIAMIMNFFKNPPLIRNLSSMCLSDILLIWSYLTFAIILLEYYLDSSSKSYRYIKWHNLRKLYVFSYLL